MECINHKDRDAVAVCTKCGAPVCTECAWTIDGAKVCPSCFQTSCYQAINYNRSNATSRFIYMGIALAFYIAGILLISFTDGLGYMLLGFLLMGLPNLYAFFNRGVGFIATASTWVVVAIMQVILGLVLTPVIVIKSAIQTARFKKQEKYWQDWLNNVTAYLNSLR